MPVKLTQGCLYGREGEGPYLRTNAATATHHLAGRENVELVCESGTLALFGDLTG